MQGWPVSAENLYSSLRYQERRKDKLLTSWSHVLLAVPLRSFILCLPINHHYQESQPHTVIPHFAIGKLGCGNFLTQKAHLVATCTYSWAPCFWLLEYIYYRDLILYYKISLISVLIVIIVTCIQVYISSTLYLILFCLLNN